jgi:hypothetical protein
MVTVPSAAAAMGVEALRLDAMSILPHGFAVLGRGTTLRWGVPLRPRAGLKKGVPIHIAITGVKQINALRDRMCGYLHSKGEEDSGQSQNGLLGREHGDIKGLVVCPFTRMATVP